jgi:hypothetical protein
VLYQAEPLPDVMTLHLLRAAAVFGSEELRKCGCAQLMLAKL